MSRRILSKDFRNLLEISVQLINTSLSTNVRALELRNFFLLFRNFASQYKTLAEQLLQCCDYICCKIFAADVIECVLSSFLFFFKFEMECNANHHLSETPYSNHCT